MTDDEITVRQSCPLGCWVVTGVGPHSPFGGRYPLHYPTEQEARDVADRAEAVSS